MTQLSENSFIKSKERSSDFLIRIMFRKNVSWQGQVHWLNTDLKRYFRSSLELIMMIQEAMEKCEVPRVEYNIRTWEQDQDATVDRHKEKHYKTSFQEYE